MKRLVNKKCELIEHIKLWLGWQRCSHMCWSKKIMVLFGNPSPTFGMYCFTHGLKEGLNSPHDDLKATMRAFTESANKAAINMSEISACGGVKNEEEGP